MYHNVCSHSVRYSITVFVLHDMAVEFPDNFTANILYSKRNDNVIALRTVTFNTPTVYEARGRRKINNVHAISWFVVIDLYPWAKMV